MNKEKEILEAIKTIRKEYKAQPYNKGKTDEEIDGQILDNFLLAFDQGKLDKESLLGIMELMGYEPTEEFLKALEEDNKK